ncbi:MAG TPA: hypothetical protein VFW93_04920, partial [Aquabacterium sp.]|uniref:hypothetical protein n=1 Tax=Aquabacterium sp. TaxID=1872578 RepID=UPI002E352EDB
MLDHSPQSEDELPHELSELIKRKGGLFISNSANPNDAIFTASKSRLSGHITYTLNHLYTSKTRTIKYGLIRSGDINAFAYASSEPNVPLDFIGVNLGALFTLLNVFFRILSHPSNFPEVGDARLENGDGAPLPWITTNVVSADIPYVPPRCPIRARFALELTFCALDFLFFHEISHLRHGHIEFIREKLKANSITEAMETEDDPSASEIRQALEIDADCGATLHSLNRAFLAFRAHNQARDSFSELEWAIVKHAYGSNALATRSICFSAYILFRIFNVGSWRIDLQPKLTHPLPPFRAYAVGATAYEIFSQRAEYEYDPDLFMFDHSRTIESAEFA